MNEISVSQKRVWYARSELMEVLTSLGLPAGITDGSHALVRGVRPVAKWLISSSDTVVSKLMSMGNEAEYAKAAGVFSAMSPVSGASVKAMAPTGFSMSDGRLVIDGCALKVAMRDGEAYVIPISRNAMSNGSEWTEIIAMVPMSCMLDWSAITGAAAVASRTLDASRMVMRVYNGNDIAISPMTLEDMVLEPSVKEAFADDIVGFLGRRAWYAERNLPWTRKYLMHGPPGTGKTSLARWASSQLSMPCLGFDFTDQFADGRTLNGCLSTASSMSPCVLVLDDIDKVLQGDNRTRITPQALQTSLSGMSNLDGVIVIATCNSTSAIRGTLADGSSNPLARRFDQIIEVPLPSSTLRAQYATKLLSKDELTPQDIEREFGSQDKDGWSYDDVRAAVTAAAGYAVSRSADRITLNDVKRGVNSIAQRKGA